MKTTPLTAAITALILLSGGLSLSAAAQEPAPQNRLYGNVSKFAVLGDDVQKSIGIKCTANGDHLLVDAVDLGSLAFEKGLQKGDLILDAQVNDKTLFINAQRGDRMFFLRLKKADNGKAASGQLQSMQPKTDALPTPATTFPLKAEKNTHLQEMEPPMLSVVPKTNIPVMTVTPQQLRLLARYDIELVVDRSMSMRQRDCPGGLSRWEWCGTQATSLARALAPYATGGITITTFAHDHEVYARSSPDKIVEIFSTPNFQLGTYLMEALHDRFNNYFSTRRPDSKPLLLAVITDGVPHPAAEPLLVKDELVQATRYMRDPREITVAFLQIGGRDDFGRRYLADLDSRLVSYGARYDIVHTKNFDQLQQIGLGQALVDSVNESLTFTKPPQQPLPEPQNLKQQMKIQRIERQMRGGNGLAGNSPNQ